MPAAPGGYGLVPGGAIRALPMTATNTAPAAMTIVANTVCLLFSLEAGGTCNERRPAGMMRGTASRLRASLRRYVTTGLRSAVAARFPRTRDRLYNPRDHDPETAPHGRSPIPAQPHPGGADGDLALPRRRVPGAHPGVAHPGRSPEICFPGRPRRGHAGAAVI